MGAHAYTRKPSHTDTWAHGHTDTNLVTQAHGHTCMHAHTNLVTQTHGHMHTWAQT